MKVKVLAIDPATVSGFARWDSEKPSEIVSDTVSFSEELGAFNRQYRSWLANQIKGFGITQVYIEAPILPKRKHQYNDAQEGLRNQHEQHMTLRRPSGVLFKKSRLARGALISFAETRLRRSIEPQASSLTGTRKPLLVGAPNGGGRPETTTRPTR